MPQTTAAMYPDASFATAVCCSGSRLLTVQIRNISTAGLVQKLNGDAHNRRAFMSHIRQALTVRPPTLWPECYGRHCRRVYGKGAEKI